MRHAFVKSMLVLAVTCLPFATVSALENSKLDEVFKTACVKAWMERADDASDKTDFQNFGEKYCGCAASQTLSTDADVDRASRVCLSQTLLHDTMDSVEAEKGLSSLTESKAIAACEDRWNLIYPKMPADVKTAMTAYCQCAAPKLMELNQDRDNNTDKQWYEKIDKIAADCADKVLPDKGTEGAKKD